jgi:hypothetical protein
MKDKQKKYQEMLESFTNGNRNNHRIEFWLMERTEKIEYIQYCLDNLNKAKYRDLLNNLSYPTKDEY